MGTLFASEAANDETVCFAINLGSKFFWHLREVACFHTAKSEMPSVASERAAPATRPGTSCAGAGTSARSRSRLGFSLRGLDFPVREGTLLSTSALAGPRGFRYIPPILSSFGQGNCETFEVIRSCWSGHEILGATVEPRLRTGRRARAGSVASRFFFARRAGHGCPAPRGGLRYFLTAGGASLRDSGA